jgi:type II restriction enzyme
MNNNVKAKIRQQLQFLRDKNVIEFVGHGQYRMKVN